MAKKPTKTAVIRCSAASPVKDGIVREGLPGDCREILAQYPDGIRECRFACLGGGSCVSACRLKAVEMTEDGIPNVNSEKCVGCGLCAKACPQSLIQVFPVLATIRPICSNQDIGKNAKAVCSESCIGCGTCEKNCPAGAIHIEDAHAVIDTDLCIACGMCAVKCPRGVIRDTDHILTK